MVDKKLFSTGLGSLIVSLLVIGLVFRFANLDKKVYWIDEVNTSIRVSAYTSSEIMELVPTGEVIGVKDLQTFQHLHPERDIRDTIQALTGNAEHSPLYYLMARFWMQWFGSSVIAMRSLPAVISLLTFPCLYWLCQELFASPWVGGIAIGLMAISPFHLLYAQEARQYSLWTVTILLSSAALLWAMRNEQPQVNGTNLRLMDTVYPRVDQEFRKSKNADFQYTVKPKCICVKWGIYAATICLGLYSHLLFLFVIVAHGGYVLIGQVLQIKTVNSLASKRESVSDQSITFLLFSQKNLSKVIIYSLATLIGIIGFFPWILVLLNNSAGMAGWLVRSLSITEITQRWLINLGSIFFDIQVGYVNPIFSIGSAESSIHLSVDNPFTYVIFAIVVIEIYAVITLVTTQPPQTWLFVLTLIVIPAMALVLPDLISGGQRSVTGRYLIPSYLGIQIAVVYLLRMKLFDLKLQTRKFWQLLLIALIFGGILSCGLSSQAETWWNKYSSYDYPQVAQVINQEQETSPLIISDIEEIGRLISLSYLLDDKVRIMLIEPYSIPDIPQGFKPVFVFKPLQKWFSDMKVEHNINIKLTHQVGDLWIVQPIILFLHLT